MRVSEFVERIVVRYDNKLKDVKQIEAFEEDCRIHLKKFEGDTLKFSFNEIVYQHKTRTHPSIAEIRKICNQKMTTDHKKENPHNAETVEYINIKNLKEDFKKTEEFKKCAAAMIGHDALLFIERNNRFPEVEELRQMIKHRDDFRVHMNKYSKDDDLSDAAKAMFDLGKKLINLNQEYYDNYRRTA